MFTLGQVDRMHAALNSTVSGRSNLWSQANLLATGTDQPLTYPNPQSCAIPIADFTASKRYICVGESVKFSDASYNGTVDTRVWTFPTDATVSSNTDAKTTVTFNSPGWQQISLEVANANGSNQKTKAMVFVVDPAQAISAPFYESFENAATAQARWQAINYDNNNTSFQYFNQGGHYSQSCYKLNYYDNNLDGDKDDLASPAFDLSNLALSDLKFSFEYSFATTDVTHLTDTSAALAVFASKDCGATWSRLYYKVGYGLFNAGVQIGGYTPGLDNQYWKKITLTLPTSFQTNSVVFRVQVTSAVDINHFYIENINIGNTTNTGLTDTKLDIESIDIVPNPSIGQATLMLESADASDVDIHLFDIQGRDMANVYQGAINAGTNQIPLNVQSLAAGVYLVHVSDGKNSIQKRFVKM
jgi:PKD repeat protein